MCLSLLLSQANTRVCFPSALLCACCVYWAHLRARTLDPSRSVLAGEFCELTVVHVVRCAAWLES